MSYMNDEYEVMRAEIQRLHRVCYDLAEENRKLRNPEYKHYGILSPDKKEKYEELINQGETKASIDVLDPYGTDMRVRVIRHDGDVWVVHVKMARLWKSLLFKKARFHKIEYGRELRDSNGQMLLSHFLLEIKTNRE